MAKVRTLGRPQRSTLLVAALTTLLLVACGDRRDPLEAARQDLERREPEQALVHLKIALQRQPDSAPGRFLMGRLLLERGQPAAAAIELSKARDLGHPPEDVLPALAQALLRQGDWRGVLQLAAGGAALPPQAQAQIQTAAASAAYRLNDREDGDARLALALRLAPDHVGARILRSQRLAADGDFAGARDVSGDTVQRHPDDAQAWLMQARLLAVDPAAATEAEAAFRRVIALHGDDLQARTGLLELLLRRKDIAAAGVEVEALRRQRPDHPATAYFETQHALLRGDVAAARSSAEKLAAAAPTQPRVARLVASVSLEAGELTQAIGQLGAALHANPGDRALRRMLALAQVRNGEAGPALDTLGPLLRPESTDAEALALAAVAALQQRDRPRAQALFQRATRHAPPDQPRLAATLALARLASGDGDAALRDLEGLAVTDSGSTLDEALISARIQRGEYEAASQALAALERKRPADPQVPLLRGSLQLRRGDTAAARASFERAAAMAPQFFPAVASLAELDLREKQPARARERFAALLTRDPGNSAALLALARVDAMLDAAPEQITRLLADAVRSAPQQPAARLRLIQHELHHGRWHAALSAADDAVQAMPADLRLLEVQAQACIAAREYQRAASVLGRLVSARPQSAEPLRQLARVQMALGRVDAAREALQRATRLEPDSARAWADAVRLEIGQRRPDAARRIAQGLQRSHPQQALGHLLQGEAALAEGAWGEAERAYGAARMRSPDLVQAAIGLHGALLGAGRTVEAERHAARWTLEHPKDADFHRYLGERALLAGDPAGARTHYREALRIQPDDAQALNNLAWAEHRLGDPDALSHAERAVRLRPAEPAFADTLAALLAAARRWEPALQQQARAVELAPDVPAYRLKLAQLHLQAGDRVRARTEIDRLQALPLGSRRCRSAAGSARASPSCASSSEGSRGTDPCAASSWADHPGVHTQTGMQKPPAQRHRAGPAPARWAPARARGAAPR